MADPVVPAATPDPVAPAAPVTPPPADDRTPFERLSREEREKFEHTGVLPTAEPAPAADEDDDPPAPAAAAPAPEAPAAPPKQTQIEQTDNWRRFVKSPVPPGLGKRQHLINEMARALAEREHAAPPPAPAPAPKPADPAPQPEAPEYDGSDPGDPFPADVNAFAEDADPYAALVRAQVKWELRKEQRVAQFHAQRTAEERAAQERYQTYAERARAFEQDHPDFVAKTAPIRQQIDPQSVLAQWLMDSPVGPQVLAHFADHPEDFARIARPEGQFRSREDAVAASFRAFVKLETRLESGSPSPSTTPAADTPAQPATAPKLLSSAPPPPRTLGERPAAPADPREAAVARQDVSAYFAEADKRDLEKARTGI